MDFKKKIEELEKKIEEDADGMEEIDKASYIFDIGKIYKEQKMMTQAIEKFKKTIAKLNHLIPKLMPYLKYVI
jgi:tetratricopeptide (TPR) repeat protein